MKRQEDAALTAARLCAGCAQAENVSVSIRRPAFLADAIDASLQDQTGRAAAEPQFQQAGDDETIEKANLEKAIAASLQEEDGPACATVDWPGPASPAPSYGAGLGLG